MCVFCRLYPPFPDGQAALDNIVVGRAHNSEHQMDLINILAAKFGEEDCYRLLIVDSIMALFRVDYSGRGELSDRQQKLNQMLSRLTRISEEYNVVVFITNQYVLSCSLLNSVQSTDCLTFVFFLSGLLLFFPSFRLYFFSLYQGSS